MRDRPVFSGHQPNFIPYMGFFYKMFQSDIFVLDDDVQYTSNDWVNKNFLKISGQRCRITIPVSHKFGDPVNVVRIHYDDRWVGKILRSIEMSYHNSKHFDLGFELIERHLMARYTLLYEMNVGLIRDIADGFGFGCKIVMSSTDCYTDMVGNERNIYQCERMGGKVYYSGVGGKAYNDEEGYRKSGIKLVYSDYTPVEYSQTGKGFIPNLSVLDYIFNQGYKIPDNWKRIET